MNIDVDKLKSCLKRDGILLCDELENELINLGVLPGQYGYSLEYLLDL